MSHILSQVLAPVSIEMPQNLQAIRENGEIVAVPFRFRNKEWITKPADQVRERLLDVKDKQDAAAFLTFAGYVVMLDVISAGGDESKPEPLLAMRPAYPVQPDQVSDRVFAYVREWQEACREILVPSYRYPGKPKQEHPEGKGTVRNLARRGTGRFNALPVAFSWDDSGKPILTLRPQTTLEASVIDCHLRRLAGLKFRQCRRHDCGRVYEATTAHVRRWCSPECAHLQVVRRSRHKKTKR